MLGDIEREALDALYPVTEIAEPAATIAARLSVLRHRPGAILRKNWEGEGRDHTGYNCRHRDQPREGMSHCRLLLGGPESAGCRPSFR